MYSLMMGMALLGGGGNNAHSLRLCWYPEFLLTCWVLTQSQDSISGQAEVATELKQAPLAIQLREPRDLIMQELSEFLCCLSHTELPGLGLGSLMPGAQLECGRSNALYKVGETRALMRNGCLKTPGLEHTEEHQGDEERMKRMMSRELEAGRELLDTGHLGPSLVFRRKLALFMDL